MKPLPFIRSSTTEMTFEIFKLYASSQLTRIPSNGRIAIQMLKEPKELKRTRNTKEMTP
jgi:hypothetical protein